MILKTVGNFFKAVVIVLVGAGLFFAIPPLIAIFSVVWSLLLVVLVVIIAIAFIYGLYQQDNEKN